MSKLRDLIEANKPKHLCNICQQSFSTDAKLQAHKMITHGPSTPPKGIKSENNMRLKSIVEDHTSRMVDLDRWWDYEPDKIMSYVYWLQRQIPPSDPKKYKENWENIKKQLQAKYPRPEQPDDAEVVNKGASTGMYEGNKEECEHHWNVEDIKYEGLFIICSKCGHLPNAQEIQNMLNGTSSEEPSYEEPDDRHPSYAPGSGEYNDMMHGDGDY